MIFTNNDIIFPHNIDLKNSSINLDETSLSVPYGTNIQEDKSYVFSGEFYDTSNLLREWSETCYLETQFVLDPDVYSNDSITSLDNTETQSPSNSSISMSYGSQYQNGTLDSLDGDPAIFSSSDDNLVEAENFTLNYGNEISTGNLTEIDGNYSEYSSSYDYGVYKVDNFTINEGSFLQNGTIFNSTYSFENDTIGGNPDDWITYEAGSAQVSVIEMFNDHHNVVKLDDQDGTYNCYIDNYIEKRESGTVEFYMAMDTTATSKQLVFNMRQVSTYGISFNMIDGYFKYYDGTWHSLQSFEVNTWYHIRVDFECGSGGYMGLSADTWNVVINDVEYSDLSFWNGLDDVDCVHMATQGAYSGYVGYVDAVGYSWDQGDGNYNASFSFEGYVGENLPYGWTVRTGASSYWTVLQTETNHKCVYECDDDNAGSTESVWVDVDDITYGTFEMWFKIDSYGGRTGILIPYYSSTSLFTLFYESGSLKTDTGGGTQTITTLSLATWYHLSIDFESTTGLYEGLSQYYFQLEIDGTQYGAYSFQNNVAFEKLAIGCLYGSADTGVINYDAIGFSWLSNYTIGNNLYESSYINYTIGDNLYSNDADLGNINNDYMVFRSTQTGHYPGTYSFENDATGSIPDGWTTSVYDETIDVINEYDEHKKIVKLYDNTGSYAVYFYQSFTGQESGSIELWYLMTAYTGTSGIFVIREGSNYLMYLDVYSGNIRAVDSTAHSFGAFTLNTWYHLRVDFECGSGGYKGLSADTYKVYMNNVEYGAYSCYSLTDNVDKIECGSFASASATQTSYYDALGYSWDSNYILGDNWHWQYYEGAYMFEDDETQDDPIGWTTSEPSGVYVDVGGLDDNHKKVGRLYQSGTNHPELRNDFVSSQETGTIELWMMSNDVTDQSFCYVYDGFSSYGIKFGFKSDKLALGASEVEYNTVYDDTWYHIRIDFNTISDDFDFYLDGIFVDTITDCTSESLSFIRFNLWTDSGNYFTYVDAVGYSWLSNYTTGDNQVLNYESTLNITSVFQFNIEDRDLSIFHSLKTDISQEINLSLYNFDTSEYDLINNSISLDFTEDYFLLNSSYYNATNHVIINVIGINSSYDFYLYFEVVYLRNSPIVEIESVIDCDLLENLVYSYKTNITQSVELYLYNFTSSSYDLIENESYLSFYLNYTSSYSDYHNGTASRVKFRAVNTTYNDFTFYLEVLKLINITRLDFTCFVELEEFYDYFLFFNCSAWYYTSIPILMNFSIYDFTNDVWILINSSNNYVGYFKSEYTEDTSDMYDLIDADNDNQVLLRFQALNNTSEFDLYLDKLEVSIYRKLLLSYTKTFTLLGTWKYRFHIPEDSYASSWYYFDVVLKEDNVEMISESNFLTTWEFRGGYDINELYQSDFSIDTWNLYDMSTEEMIIDVDNIDNYLLDGGYEHIISTFSFYESHLIDISFVGGMVVVDDILYVVNGDDETVYLYDLDFNFQTSYSVSETSYPFGITYDGTYFYVGSYYDERVYVYDSTFNYVEYHSISETDGVVGIVFVDNYFYIASQDDVRIYVYDSTFNYVEYHSISDSSSINGITYDDDHFYVSSTDTSFPYTRRIRLYDTDFQYETNVVITYYPGYGLYHNDFIFHLGGGTFGDGYYISTYRFNSYAIPKFYQSNSYVYIQTNTTETISMYSDISTLSLQSGDKIDITFNTTSSNEIDFYLMNSDTQLKSFILSEQGNINYNTRTVSLNVDDDYSVNKIRFGGIFDDTKNLIVSDIIIYRYDESSDIYVYDVNPNGLRSIYLDYPINYSYSIYENDILKDSGYIYTSSTLQTLVYERIDQRIVYLTFHDLNNEYLEFTNYQTYVNFTYDAILYENQTMTNDIIYVDVETSIDFKIYDSFDVLIEDTTRNVQTHIDIILSVYSLKIKNEATKNVSYTLTKGSVNKSGYVFPDEIVEFSVSTGIYTLTYINYENGVEMSENITVSDHTLYSIETIFHQIYFAPFLSDGMGLSFESVRFYINGSRKDFGFNTIMSSYINITVLDFFNQTAYTEILNTDGINEYNIYLELFYLKITNKATLMANYTINKGNINETGDILVDEIISYLFVSGNYIFYYTNAENDETDSILIHLIEDYTITINTSYYQVYFSVFNYDGLGLDGNLFRFYVNGLRKDFGFNTLSQDSNNLVVKDFFNATLKDVTVDLSSYAEYNLIVEVYTIFILNNYNRTIKIEIDRGGSDMTFEQIIPSRSGLEYRFLPGIEYVVSAYEQNGTLLETQTFTLDSQYMIVDFGFYQTELPIIPEPFIQSNYMILFIIFCAIVIISIIGIIISFRYKKKSDFEEKSSLTKNKLKNVKSGVAFDFRLIE